MCTKTPRCSARVSVAMPDFATAEKSHVHVIDPEAPQGVVCTQFASENGHTLWNPAFTINKGIAKPSQDEERRGVRSATTDINVYMINGAARFNTATIPSANVDGILASAFAGVCVSNTMINPADSKYAAPPDGTKRFKKMKDEFRMSVAVAGVVCMPYVQQEDQAKTPKAGDLVRFTCAKVGITGKGEYVPSIVKWDPASTTVKPFGVCLEKPSDTATDIRVLLRRDLSQPGIAKSK